MPLLAAYACPALLMPGYSFQVGDRRPQDGHCVRGGSEPPSAATTWHAHVAATEREALPVEELEKGLRVAAAALHPVSKPSQADLVVGSQQLLESLAGASDGRLREPEVLVNADRLASSRQGVQHRCDLAGRSAQLLRQLGECRRRKRLVAKTGEQFLRQRSLLIAEHA